ncbi:MAG: CotH kinase family protein [Planctomycetia bacterium]|nr:CotH kinase family protein [Planctomycetia bacterium]
MIRKFTACWLLALVALGAASTALVPAQQLKPATAATAFFNSGKVLEISIELGPKELDSLRREPRKYVKGTLKEGDKVYTDVGIHVKGAAGSTRSIDDKPGLTLNMDKFNDGQRFHGMDKLHLSNSVQDPSYVSELICGELFRAAGVPASRVGHAVVTINGKRRGLYYVKEGYDRDFLERHFKNSHGNFYDGGFLREIDQPLQLLSSKNDVANHADLKALTAAAREPNPEQRWQKLEKVLDMDRFISYLVLEVITWDWDGYPMNRNNYRIYHDPERDKLVFIPSGMDQMFGDPNGPMFPNFNGFLARAVLETPAGKEKFRARMAEIMKTVFDPEALVVRLEELKDRVQPALTAIDPGAGREYHHQINRLANAMRQRAKKMDEHLAALNRK